MFLLSHSHSNLSICARASAVTNSMIKSFILLQALLPSSPVLFLPLRLQQTPVTLFSFLQSVAEFFLTFDIGFFLSDF